MTVSGETEGVENERRLTPAQSYHDYFGAAVVARLAGALVELVSPKPGDRVVDVACGTGILVRLLASRVGSSGTVVGVDVSPGMIDVARSEPTSEGASVEFLEGDATNLDLPDASFDLAYCQQGLQFFPDRGAGASEMRRVLRAGGRAVIAVWRGFDHHPMFEALADAEEKNLVAAGIKASRAELELPFSLGDADELRDLLTNADFAEVDVVERTIEARFADAERFVDRVEFAYGAIVPEFVEDRDAFAAFVEGVKADTKMLVEAYRQGEQVVFPMHAHVAIAS